MALKLNNYLLTELADLVQDLQAENLMTCVYEQRNVYWSYNNIINCPDSPEELITFINFLIKDLEFLTNEEFKQPST